MRTYTVYADNGSVNTLFAQNTEDAVESYYRMLESTIGHHLKICSCFNNGVAQPIDRSKVSKPVRVVQCGDDEEKP